MKFFLIILLTTSINVNAEAYNTCNRLFQTNEALLLQKINSVAQEYKSLGSAFLPQILNELKKLAQQIESDLTLSKALCFEKSDLDHASELDHIGIVMPYVESAFFINNMPYGFNLEREFPSSIVAKELGTILGRESQVPTHIYIVSSVGLDQNKIKFEFFVPQLSDKDFFKINEKNYITHIAYKISTLQKFDNIVSSLLQLGYRMPQYMGNKPMYNATQESTTAYFDLQYEGTNIRIELIYQKELL